MGFLDLLKPSGPAKETPVWRDNNGNIRCPGDSCPKDCDSTCPIYLNTKAMGLMAAGQGTLAIPVYENIVKIAPDFYDGWNNLAALNGMNGNAERAYECYLKAHECDPEKSQPLYGLAVASKDIGKKDECIKWCDEYERIAHDHMTDKVREAVSGTEEEDDDDGLIFPESTLERRATAIVQNFLEDQRTLQIMDYRGGLPHIPEIMMSAGSICDEVFQNLQKEVESADQLAFLTPMWCSYAGMGAVAKWNDDWPKLRDKGILASLTEERGYFAMDEFVYDYIGIGWDSDECHSVQKILREFSETILTEASTKDGKFDMTYYFEALKAMYMYGMVFEMSRLGMH